MSHTQTQAGTVHLTDANFEDEVIRSETPVLVDFWAEWCGPCRIIGPVVEDLADEFAGRVRVGKLNVDEHPAVAEKFGIRGIPALLLFKDGEIAGQAVGVRPKAELRKLIESVI
jgi:thioredoxin 1